MEKDNSSAAGAAPIEQGQAASIATRAAEIKARLANGGYASADDYFADKDLLRQITADRVGKRQTETDPVGFWHGRQS